MNVTYKRASLEDLDILTATRIQVLRAANQLDDRVDMALVERESYQYYKRELTDWKPGDRYSAAPNHVAYLVYEGDKLVGAGGVSFYQVMPTYHNPSGKKAYIMNMYTDPDYRRQGIAYHTLGLLLKACEERGMMQISLEATNMGRPLYEKYGFVSMKDEMELLCDPVASTTTI